MSKNKNNNNFSLKSNIESNIINQRLNEAKTEMGIYNIQSVKPTDIDNWEYRDRKEFEIGSIDELAQNIKDNGQVQPIIVVKRDNVFKSNDNLNTKYIVIAGYRRWLACKSIGIDVQAILKEMSFEQAVACVIDENRKESVSDYSKGMFYKAILDSNNINQESLSKKVGLSLSSIKNYLSFSRIDANLLEAINNFSNISSRTAVEISSLCNKGQNYIDALISISDKIRAGAGEKTIKKEVDNIINGSIDISNNDKYFYSNGKEAFRSDKNKIEIKINKLSDKQREKLTKIIKENLEKYTKDNINSF